MPRSGHWSHFFRDSNAVHILQGLGERQLAVLVKHLLRGLFDLQVVRGTLNVLQSRVTFLLGQEQVWNWTHLGGRLGMAGTLRDENVDHVFIDNDQGFFKNRL